ncbi:MAG: hypothetical protein EOO41_02380 [Methanobacteriota archaeon]|nr:MAG: hypothetical protein EOO41_02380 [Euryarchaeota archaeon]
MSQLPNDVILSFLLAVLTGIVGGLRVRGHPEAWLIWQRGYKYPPRWMPLYGAMQLAAGVLSVFMHDVGACAVIAVSVMEAANHTVRQKNPLASVLDVTAAGVALALAVMEGVAPATLAACAGAGLAAWMLMHFSFPQPASVRKTQ